MLARIYNSTSFLWGNKQTKAEQAEPKLPPPPERSYVISDAQKSRIDNYFRIKVSNANQIQKIKDLLNMLALAIVVPFRLEERNNPGIIFPPKECAILDRLDNPLKQVVRTISQPYTNNNYKPSDHYENERLKIIVSYLSDKYASQILESLANNEAANQNDVNYLKMLPFDFDEEFPTNYRIVKIIFLRQVIIQSKCQRIQKRINDLSIQTWDKYLYYNPANKGTWNDKPIRNINDYSNEIIKIAKLMPSAFRPAAITEAFSHLERRSIEWPEYKGGHMHQINFLNIVLALYLSQINYSTPPDRQLLATVIEHLKSGPEFTFFRQPDTQITIQIDELWNVLDTYCKEDVNNYYFELMNLLILKLKDLIYRYPSEFIKFLTILLKRAKSEMQVLELFRYHRDFFLNLFLKNIRVTGCKYPFIDKITTKTINWKVVNRTYESANNPDYMRNFLILTTLALLAKPDLEEDEIKLFLQSAFFLKLADERESCDHSIFHNWETMPESLLWNTFQHIQFESMLISILGYVLNFTVTREFAWEKWLKGIYTTYSKGRLSPKHYANFTLFFLNSFHAKAGNNVRNLLQQILPNSDNHEVFRQEIQILFSRASNPVAIQTVLTHFGNYLTQSEILNKFSESTDSTLQAQILNYIATESTREFDYQFWLQKAFDSRKHEVLSKGSYIDFIDQLADRNKLMFTLPLDADTTLSGAVNTREKIINREKWLVEKIRMGAKVSDEEITNESIIVYFKEFTDPETKVSLGTYLCHRGAARNIDLFMLNKLFEENALFLDKQYKTIDLRVTLFCSNKAWFIEATEKNAQKKTELIINVRNIFEQTLYAEHILLLLINYGELIKPHANVELEDFLIAHFVKTEAGINIAAPQDQYLNLLQKIDGLIQEADSFLQYLHDDLTQNDSIHDKVAPMDLLNRLKQDYSFYRSWVKSYTSRVSTVTNKYEQLKKGINIMDEKFDDQLETRLKTLDEKVSIWGFMLEELRVRSQQKQIIPNNHRYSRAAILGRQLEEYLELKSKINALKNEKNELCFAAQRNGIIKFLLLKGCKEGFQIGRWAELIKIQDYKRIDEFYMVPPMAKPTKEQRDVLVKQKNYLEKLRKYFCQKCQEGAVLEDFNNENSAIN